MRASETISQIIIETIFKEHNFKKNMLFAMINRLIDIIEQSDDEERQQKFQALTPVIDNIVETSLKNDQQLLKLLEIVKKNTAAIDSDFGEDSEDYDYDELIALTETQTEDTKELAQKIKNDLKQISDE